MKTQYRVKIREIHVGFVNVLANDENEAMDKANKYIEANDLEMWYESTEDDMEVEVID